MTAFRLTLRGLLAGGALLLACPSLAIQPVLRIGDQKGSAQPLMEAADGLGGLPYQLKWTQFACAPMLMEALNADAIDAGGIGDAPFVSGIASGIPTRAGPATQSDGAVTAVAVAVPAVSPIRTLADPQGRSVVTFKRQAGHFCCSPRCARRPSDLMTQYSFSSRRPMPNRR